MQTAYLLLKDFRDAKGQKLRVKYFNDVLPEIDIMTINNSRTRLSKKP